MHNHMINRLGSLMSKIVSNLRLAMYACRRGSLLVGILLAFLTPQISASNLEEIVVTARKKAESLQDSPISITALSGDRLEEMGLTRVTRLQDVTPNLVFQNTPTFSGVGNNAAVYIRGIGQRDFIPTIDPGVGIYIDENLVRWWQAYEYCNVSKDDRSPGCVPLSSRAIF